MLLATPRYSVDLRRRMLRAMGRGQPLGEVDASLLADEVMTGPLFLAWVEQSLAPTLSPGDVVVMDNLNCHKVAGVEEAVEEAGASVWYLPLYLPDTNPIEKAWSKVKAFLRDAEAATPDGLEEAVAEALASVTADDYCLGFLKSCGYRA